MRNGNVVYAGMYYGLYVEGSYRTYEEWKLAYEQSFTIIIYVLTVPMRNGN